MKLKIGFTLVLFCLVGYTYGQDYKDNTKSLKEFDTKIEEGQYKSDDSISADKLIIETTEQTKQEQTSISSYSEEEWVAIRKEITVAKERVTQNKEIFASKVIDTIFITLPAFTTETQLSGW